MILFRQFPNCTIDCCGASFVVASLTDGETFPSQNKLNDRSRMTLNDLLLCGMQAAGESLSSSGISSFMSPQRTIFACPFRTLSRASEMRACRANLPCAELCGTWSSAFMMCSSVHGVPQSSMNQRMRESLKARRGDRTNGKTSIRMLRKACQGGCRSH